MSQRVFARLKTFRSGTQAPEEDVALRIVIGVAVMIAITGLLAQDIVDASIGIPVLLLTPLGFYVSWRRRHLRNVALKIALAAGALLAFANFLRAISGAGSIDETRTPLAEIFLWVQTLNSFDQPKRKNLHFSLASSLVIVAQAASLAVDLKFLPLVLLWGLTVLTALSYSYASDARERHQTSVRPAMPLGSRPSRRRIPLGIRAGAATIATVLVVASMAFLFAPRGSGRYLAGFPFRIPNIVSLGTGAGIVNPGLSNNSSPGVEPGSVAAGAYFGFGNFVDLRVRGSLPDEVVLRVRADRPAFWRGMVFDTYSDSVWTSSDTEPQPSIGLPADIPREKGIAQLSDETVTQTFYVERDQPNIIFAAYHPSKIWFPDRVVEYDDYRALRARVLLTDDTVYSVVSELPLFSHEDLEVGIEGVPPEILGRYTEMPANIPARVRKLAVEIAGDSPTIIGKVEAIERWLGDNTRYEIEIPRQPRGTDAVDHFLFVERRGFCEQIATSMAVMLRALGVPTRFATGYAPGDRNLFSGFFDVKASDAHSWVEVYFPGVGWVDFDPTHEVPPSDPSSSGSYAPGFGLIRRITGAIENLIPDAIPRAIGSALKAVLEAAASSGPRLAGILGAVAGAVFLGRFLAPRIRRRLRARRLRQPLKGPPDVVVPRAFALIEEAGARAGVARHVSATPGEYAVELLAAHPVLPRGDLERVIASLQREVYAGTRVTSDEAAATEKAARRVCSGLVGLSLRE